MSPMVTRAPTAARWWTLVVKFQQCLKLRSTTTFPAARSTHAQLPSIILTDRLFSQCWAPSQQKYNTKTRTALPPCTVYIVKAELPAVVGRDLISALNIHIHGESLQAFKTSKASHQGEPLDPLLRKNPSLIIKDLGTYPDYEHVIILRADSKPTVTKPRTVLVLGPALENSALGSKKLPLLSFLCSFGLLPCEPEQLQIFERRSPRFLWPTSFPLSI